MLLVDHRQADVVEVGALLDQGVSADHEVEHAGFHLLVNLTLARRAHAAGQERHPHRPAERRSQAEVVPELVVPGYFAAGEQALERLIVLRSQHLRRRHQSCLMACSD